MSTKAQLTTSNNTKIRANVGIIDRDTDHATFNAELVDEMFPTTTNVVLATGALQYNLNFTKTGNVCVLQGFVKNNSGTILTNPSFYTITNPLFQAKVAQIFVGSRNITSNLAKINLTNSASTLPNQIILLGAMSGAEVVSFSLTYIVND